MRFIAFGDSHCMFVDKRALHELARFRKAFELDIVIGLGDLVDFSALRAHATEEDRAMSIEDDMAVGMSVL